MEDCKSMNARILERQKLHLSSANWSSFKQAIEMLSAFFKDRRGYYPEALAQIVELIETASKAASQAHAKAKLAESTDASPEAWDLKLNELINTIRPFFGLFSQNPAAQERLALYIRPLPRSSSSDSSVPPSLSTGNPALLPSSRLAPSNAATPPGSDPPINSDHVVPHAPPGDQLASELDPNGGTTLSRSASQPLRDPQSHQESSNILADASASTNRSNDVTMHQDSDHAFCADSIASTPHNSRVTSPVLHNSSKSVQDRFSISPGHQSMELSVNRAQNAPCQQAPSVAEMPTGPAVSLGTNITGHDGAAPKESVPPNRSTCTTPALPPISDPGGTRTLSRNEDLVSPQSADMVTDNSTTSPTLSTAALHSTVQTAALPHSSTTIPATSPMSSSNFNPSVPAKDVIPESWDRVHGSEPPSLGREAYDQPPTYHSAREADSSGAIPPVRTAAMTFVGHRGSDAGEPAERTRAARMVNAMTDVSSHPDQTRYVPMGVQRGSFALPGISWHTLARYVPLVGFLEKEVLLGHPPIIFKHGRKHLKPLLKQMVIMESFQEYIAIAARIGIIFPVPTMEHPIMLSWHDHPIRFYEILRSMHAHGLAHPSLGQVQAEGKARYPHAGEFQVIAQTAERARRAGTIMLTQHPQEGFVRVKMAGLLEALCILQVDLWRYGLPALGLPSHAVVPQATPISDCTAQPTALSTSARLVTARTAASHAASSTSASHSASGTPGLTPDARADEQEYQNHKTANRVVSASIKTSGPNPRPKSRFPSTDAFVAPTVVGTMGETGIRASSADKTTFALLGKRYAAETSDLDAAMPAPKRKKRVASVETATAVAPSWDNIWDKPTLNASKFKLDWSMVHYCNMPAFSGKLFDTTAVIVLLDVALGAAHPSRTSLQFELGSDVMARIQQWNKRSANIEDVSNAICISMTCHRLGDVNDAHTVAPGLSQMELMNGTPCVWPMNGMVQGTAKCDDSVLSAQFQLSPPMVVSSNNSLDISAHISGSKPRLILEQSGDMREWVFALWAHAPTAAQLDKLAAQGTRKERAAQLKEQIERSSMLTFPSPLALVA